MKIQTLMKKIGITLGALVLATNLLPSAGGMTVEASTVKTFPDVKDFKEEISYLTSLGIIHGHTDGTFKPLDSLKRVHAVQMVLREMGITKFDAPNPGFADLKPGAYGYNEVAKAVQMGFIHGSTNKNGQKVFDPNGTLTRGQMAKILTEAYEITKDNNMTFTDVPAGHWTKPFVSRLATANITVGYPDGTFKPNDKIQRQHFSAFMARHLNPKFKPAPVEPKPTPAPAPTKDTYLSMTTAGKQLMATVSPNSSVSKLYSKYSNELYVATLMPSSDAQLSARYGVVYFYHDTKKVTKLHINTQRYRDNKNLRANGDTAILSATDSVFGKGTNGSKQIHDFIKANINATSDSTKKMTFGGNSATVSVTEWDIQITFH